ncbi:MAG: DUF4167 domain-containing protein [Pseudomonadota bacterium]
MRSPQKNNRARGRGNRKSNGNNANRVYESAGPEGKVRGTPQQIIEKYLTLARDAQTSGDRVVAENFLQHAEHYQRILILAQAQSPGHGDRREGSGGEGEQPPQQQRNGPENDAADEPEKQPATMAVAGLTTIDAEDDGGGALLVAEDEMSTSQPSKPRRNGRAAPKDDKPSPESAEAQPAEVQPDV